MVTNTDKQLNIQRKVDPGETWACRSVVCSDVSKTVKFAARFSHTIKYSNLYNISGLK